MVLLIHLVLDFLLSNPQGLLVVSPLQIATHLVMIGITVVMILRSKPRCRHLIHRTFSRITLDPAIGCLGDGCSRFMQYLVWHSIAIEHMLQHGDLLTAITVFEELLVIELKHQHFHYWSRRAQTTWSPQIDEVFAEWMCVVVVTYCCCNQWAAQLLHITAELHAFIKSVGGTIPESAYEHVLPHRNALLGAVECDRLLHMIFQEVCE